jgi:hypothetical protein
MARTVGDSGISVHFDEPRQDSFSLLEGRLAQAGVCRDFVSDTLALTLQLFPQHLQVVDDPIHFLHRIPRHTLQQQIEIADRRLSIIRRFPLRLHDVAAHQFADFPFRISYERLGFTGLTPKDAYA